MGHFEYMAILTYFTKTVLPTNSNYLVRVNKKLNDCLKIQRLIIKYY